MSATPERSGEHVRVASAAALAALGPPENELVFAGQVILDVLAGGERASWWSPIRPSDPPDQPFERWRRTQNASRLATVAWAWLVALRHPESIMPSKRLAFEERVRGVWRLHDRPWPADVSAIPAWSDEAVR